MTDQIHYHFIGIGGIGMSGLARILVGRGYAVSGSDINRNYVTEALEKSGIKVFDEQNALNISSDMLVIYSSDIKKDNPEYAAAIKKGCQLFHRSDLLAQLMTDSHSLAIAGTHGKTTTTSLLTTVLIETGRDPTFVVGGIIAPYQTNAREGKGNYFVAEADESDGTFTKYHPWGAIVTNIDGDHLNYFKTWEALVASFQQFASHIKSNNQFFWCGDDENLVKLNFLGISYGFNENNELLITNFRQNGWKISYDCHYKDHHYLNIEVPLAGKHNALNSAAVFGLCLELGMPEEEIRKGLAAFKGVARRCEKKIEYNQVLFLDDYAHHPTEINATLRAVKSAIGIKRLIAVFQPHRYSRLQYCLNLFGNVFNDADEVIVTDIYSAGESPIPGITSKAIIESIAKEHLSCRYYPRDELAAKLICFVQPGDVVITLGAGDITKLSIEIEK